VGVITGVTSAGYASTGAMPAGSVGEVAKKAYVTGAIGGISVAASGGDEAAVRDAFLKSGGMVVVQSGQSYLNKTYVNPGGGKDGLVLHVSRGRQMLGDFVKTASRRSRKGHP
jgi:hypothetical protein